MKSEFFRFIKNEAICSSAHYITCEFNEEDIMALILVMQIQINYAVLLNLKKQNNVSRVKIIYCIQYPFIMK